MSSILDTHRDPESAASAWIQAHPEVLASWLDGVRAIDGTPALLALQPQARRAVAHNADQWIVDHKIPVGDFMARLIDFIKTHGTVFFRIVSATIGGAVNGLTRLLIAIPSLLLVGVFVALAWLPRHSWGLALFVALALLFIINQGYWAATCETLSLVSLSALVSTLVGVPIGIAAAHRPRLYASLRPVLDLMQTLPTFVYLIPTLVLFGLGVVPGLISTVIFALPAPIRLTHLGISSVPVALREAGEAFGATRMQLLWKVELPSAAPSIMTGITQCTMLCLSMVVIAALVGAGGLGVPVVRALNTVQVGMGFEAGFAIVLLAIVLDRMSRSANRERK
jgi:choline ABC transporter permease protein